MKPISFALVSVCAFAIGLGGHYVWRQYSKPPLQLQQATILANSGRPMPDFELQDYDNGSFTRAQLKDHWTLLFFGYTSCPDVCPLTLAVLKDVYRRLEETPYAQDTQIVFVSVDPKRDSLSTLKRYVQHFHPIFKGVTGSEGQLQKFTKPLGIFYQYQGEGEDYLVDHSSAMLLIDPAGNLRALFSAPHHANMLSQNYVAIRENV
ncbi:MAG: SCO family protein [Gammaproteobacteria bacterium]|jgi:protein SCO1/2|nr:SCO family protein [Gammaproteobacteria bacterium]